MSTAVDWDALSLAGVMETCELQAHKVASQYVGVIEFGDLLQEAYIAVATHAGTVRSYIANEEHGFLAHWVWSRLQDVARKEANYRNRVVPIDLLVEP